MKLLVILALISIAAAIGIPPKKGQQKDEPNCGLRSAPKTLPRKIHKEATFVCEMCLDLVQIFEMYAECDEADINAKMDAQCDNYFHSAVLDKVCRSMIDDVMAEMEKDTNADASPICSKITKNDCHYA